MLRTRSILRVLSPSDRDAALELCAQDVAANVFVAARIIENGLDSRAGTVLGRRTDGDLDSLVWASANIVPVALDREAWGLYAERLRRWRSRTASVLGPADQVLGLWEDLEPGWGPARAVRSRQPVLGTRVPPSARGIDAHPLVRPARPDEVDLVLPAAEHMFTGEIGYRPYVGSARAYRQSLRGLIEAGRTYVIVDAGRVIFKADVGSVALGCAQLQGVWVAPDLRGRGLAVPAMAAVVEQVMNDHAPFVTLYVNDFNVPALATYARIGMTPVGTYATVLL
ncbi:MAG: GNAT family N-acetyltransferase [Nostocoides sp.]